MSEAENLKIRIQKKEDEIKNLKEKMKKKKTELQILQDRLEKLLEQEEVVFNAKVVAEMERRFGKFDEESLKEFLQNLDAKSDFSNTNLF